MISHKYDPAQCITVPPRVSRGLSQRAALLMSEGSHEHGPYRISFEARLVAPWYVRLTRHRVLRESELVRVRQYKEGDDWLSLVRSLRDKL
jgi:hypothetical protein